MTAASRPTDLDAFFGERKCARLPLGRSRLVTGIAASVLLLLAAALPAGAEYRPLEGEALSGFLTGIVAIGTASRQTFAADGTTSYSENGRVSPGRWEVRDGLYCSQWPPNDQAWTCYRVEIDREEKLIRWTGDSGEPEINHFENRGAGN